jgi:hypothetical protein
MLHMSSFMLRTFSSENAGATMLRMRRCSGVEGEAQTRDLRVRE